MSHIVYLLRFKRKTIPNLYIGCKSNCEVKDNKILSKRGVYTGSSKDLEFRQLIRKNLEYKIEVLYEGKSYKDVLAMERTIQLQYNVVVSPRFFNKTIAMENTYTNPAYATMRHVATGKVARIRRDSIGIESGEWVGITLGRKMSKAERARHGRSGKANGFFGKKHTKKTVDVIRAKNIANGSGPWNKRSAASKARYMKAVRKPHSLEHRRKIGEARHRFYENLRNQASRKEKSL